jgi:hypothetical protein
VPIGESLYTGQRRREDRVGPEVVEVERHHRHSFIWSMLIAPHLRQVRVD